MRLLAGWLPVCLSACLPVLFFRLCTAQLGPLGQPQNVILLHKHLTIWHYKPTRVCMFVWANNKQSNPYCLRSSQFDCETIKFWFGFALYIKWNNLIPLYIDWNNLIPLYKSGTIWFLYILFDGLAIVLQHGTTSFLKPLYTNLDSNKLLLLAWHLTPREQQLQSSLHWSLINVSLTQNKKEMHSHISLL